MKFTKEAWEAAPEGATVEGQFGDDVWDQVHLVGFSIGGDPVVQLDHGKYKPVASGDLRIVLPKRRVKVRLWRDAAGNMFATPGDGPVGESWKLLGEHTFEIEGE